MSGKENPREHAMRLLEALSGTEEALLERCEEDRGTSRPLRGRIFSWPGMRTLAATLCLAVVGAASWGGYQWMHMGSNENSSGMSMQPIAIEGEEERAGEAAPQDLAGQVEEANGLSVKGEAQSGDVSEGSGNTFRDNMSSSDGADSASMESAIEEEKEQQAEDVLTEGCPALEARKITEAEAKNEPLGAYLPQIFPKGYVFEEAYSTVDSEKENLTICWSRGMDSIMLFITKEETVPETVDPERTEVYDLRLYKIPYADSVPKEYRESVDNPVFAAEDLSLEIIRSRMVSYDDAGDTDTPRGNFGVLYPDGVLVRFNGRGTAAEIWEMFSSIDR